MTIVPVSQVEVVRFAGNTTCGQSVVKPRLSSSAPYGEARMGTNLCSGTCKYAQPSALSHASLYRDASLLPQNTAWRHGGRDRTTKQERVRERGRHRRGSDHSRWAWLLLVSVSPLSAVRARSSRCRDWAVTRAVLLALSLGFWC